MSNASLPIFESPIRWDGSGDLTALFPIKYEDVFAAGRLPRTAGSSPDFFASQQESDDTLSVIRPGLNQLLAQINRVMTDDDDYDAEFLRPTSYARDIARRLIIQAGDTVGNSFPPAALYPDGSGGIRIEWMKQRKRLHLIISPQSETGYFLYEQDGKAFHSTDNVSSLWLGNRLRWLNDEHLSASGM